MTQDRLTPVWRAREWPETPMRGWEDLLGQARATRLGARLAHHIEQRRWEGHVPEPCRPHLAAIRRYADLLHRDALNEIDHIAQALQHVPTPVVLLKGAAYVAAGLPPARGRLFSDIDILVEQPQLRAVEMALLAGGWIAEKLDPYDDRYYREWMHELPPLQHVQRRSYLDVHHTIAPPTSRIVIDGAKLLASAVALNGHAQLRVLAPYDMVLHSAVHLMQEGEFGAGLRDLLDIRDLVELFARDDGFWPTLLTRARELNVEMPLAHVLLQLDRLFGTPMPAAAQALGGRAAKRHGGLMARLLAVALRPEHPSCAEPGAGLARWLLYVRSHWLRMPWYQIAPHLLRKAWVRMVARLSAKDEPPGDDASPAQQEGRGGELGG